MLNYFRNEFCLAGVISELVFNFWNSSAPVWLEMERAQPCDEAHQAFRLMAEVVVSVLRDRKRARKEQTEDEDADLTAAATPKRRIIKLTSIKELRAEICDNTHTGSFKYVPFFFFLRSPPFE